MGRSPPPASANLHGNHGDIHTVEVQVEGEAVGGTDPQGGGHDGRVGGWSRMGHLVVLILAMAGFWVLVVGATMALFRGVHGYPAVRRGTTSSGSRVSRARTFPVSHDNRSRVLEPSWTPPGSLSAGPSANLHGKPAQTFVRGADCGRMSEVDTTPSGGRQGRSPAGGSAPALGVGPPVVVTVVEATACHLCEDAKSALAVLALSYPIAVHVLSISDEPGRALMQHHRAPMSPLVLLDGQYFSSGRLPRRKLERRLAKLQRGETHE